MDQPVWVPDRPFDPSQALLSDTDLYPPLYVTRTRQLREALAARDVRDDTPILLVTHEAWTLALPLRLMALHHVAQGEMAGRAWMASF